MDIKKAAFRQRVYQLPDGTIQLVFGNDPGPVDAKLLADHDVIETQTVTAHVGLPE